MPGAEYMLYARACFQEQLIEHVPAGTLSLGSFECCVVWRNVTGPTGVPLNPDLTKISSPIVDVCSSE